MRLFSQSTVASLSAARRALGAAEATIAQLETKRAAKLLDGDDIADVQQIDAALSAQRVATFIYRDKIAALIERQRQEERARLEAEKAAHIADVAKRVEARNAKARAVDQATAALCAAFAELTAADAALVAEPSRSHRSILSMRPFVRRPYHPSDHDAAPRMVIGTIRALVDRPPEVEGEVAQKGRDLIEVMQAEPIVEPVSEVDGAEEAA